MDALYLRFFWVGWAGQELGQSTFDARLAYDYLRDHLPADVITQSNPVTLLEKPGGLYGTRQMVIADRTGYGVPLDILNKFVDEIGIIFTTENQINWQFTDRICQNYSIDILIINDADPIWSSLVTLKAQRPSIYENSHYALFACGKYAQNK